MKASCYVCGKDTAHLEYIEGAGMFALCTNEVCRARFWDLFTANMAPEQSADRE